MMKRVSGIVLALWLGACSTMQGQLEKPAGTQFLSSAALHLPTAVEGRFALRDSSGRAITDGSYAGRARLVYLGYTSCPEICGLELTTMAAAADEVGVGSDELVLLFITLDPVRDTPEMLAGFTSFFHPDLVGLRGSEVETGRVIKSFGAYGRAASDMGELYYKVDHSTFIYLFDRDGRFVRAFSYRTPPEEIAAELRAILART
jgi:protein SCO1